MTMRHTISVCIAGAIGSFALLLLIISVGTPVWLDNGSGSTIGLFSTCYGDNVATTIAPGGPGCYNEDRAPSAGLSVVGILLLSGSIILTIIGALSEEHKKQLLGASVVLCYFSSMFVMSAYVTWGVYSRDENLYTFPSTPPASLANHTAMGSSYNLCVAAHYFLWTALTIIAAAFGYTLNTR
ncbi:unnamed protein product [Rotaria socialis]|uniref:Uncharacterized protein n=1 Tax=Rotaria socialis TaxID=392032 RepID=A0A817Y9R1_9BILA|nr:unnamed protein product [Rotaria socialis]CAF4637231.1 unnamed protein product [Rotaria socialis]